MKTAAFRLSLSIGALCLLTEVTARLSGIASVPVYYIDRVIGYIPGPSQSGAFLHRNDWMFNERSMGAPPFSPAGKSNVLLLGDSIVYGGNAYRQLEKLGPCLQSQLGGNSAVWPVGAGKWAALNEIAYLDRNPDLASQMKYLVWVVITGDFRHRTQSWSPLIHPKHPPMFASLYGLRRYVLPALHITQDPEFISVKEENADIFDATIPVFKSRLSSLRKTSPILKLLVVLYPDSYEFKHPGGTSTLLVASALRKALPREGASLCEVAGDSRWHSSYYRDFIHPTAEGNHVLATIIATNLKAADAPRL